MSTPSILGDLGYQVTAVLPLTTSTARYMVLRLATASDTGTLLTTSRTLDLSRGQHVGATGGKPLDVTVHPRSGGPTRLHDISVVLPLELQFHDSGLNFYATVTHKHRAAASGAGSTWDTLKTDQRRVKMGTDTDAYFHTGFVSSVNAQAVRRFYKANITFSFRKASSTAAKDTTTAIGLVCNSPIILLRGGQMPSVHGPRPV
jgi:hypothetical protein